MKLALQGVTYLDYGWQNIISSLQSSLTRPIDQRTDSEVTAVREIQSETGPLVAVTAGGDTKFFDFVILAVPPAVVQKIAPSLLPQELTDSFVSSKIACFDVCLRNIPRPENIFALGMNEPLYYTWIR